MTTHANKLEAMVALMEPVASKFYDRLLENKRLREEKAAGYAMGLFIKATEGIPCTVGCFQRPRDKRNNGSFRWRAEAHA